MSGLPPPIGQPGRRSDETRLQKMSSPFSLTFANPARALSLAAELLAPLRGLIRLVWPLAGLAAVAAYFNWYDLLANLDLQLQTLSILHNLVLSMLTTNLISRLFMGVTMAYYEAPPQQFGLRLLYGVIPRFFVSTATIRQLDFPQQRACYAAPLLTRLSIFWLGILAWVMLRRTGSGLAGAGLVLGATGLGSFLFTLNPIWRADGYHWTAAYFRMPDLREQSYRLVWLILRRKPIPEMLPESTIRGLIFYAVASVAFTTGLILIVLSSIAYALEAQFRGAGVIMFAVIVSMMLLFLLSRRSRRSPARRKARRAAAGRALPHPVEISRRRSDSCYTSAEPVSVDGTRKGFDRMNRIKAETSDHGPAGDGAQPGDETASVLDDILPASSGAEPPETSTDAELEAILGPPAAAGPDDAYDALLDAALEPPAGPEPERGDPAPPADKGRGEPPAPSGTGNLPAVVSPPKPPQKRPRSRASDELDPVLRLGRAKRTRGSKLRRLAIWAVLLAGLYYAAIQPYPFTVGGDFIVQPVARTQVRARTDGEITRINVTEGDWVAAGDVLAVLSKWDEERDIAVLEADLSKLRADLETLTAGPRPAEIALAGQELAAATTKVDLARQELERKEQLFASETVSQKALDEAKSQYRLAITERDQAQSRLELLQSSALESEIAAANANIRRKEQELTFSRLQLEHTNIRAGGGGQIVSTMENVSVGTFLKEGDLFAELADNRTVLAEIEVPETEIDEAAIGAQVVLKSWSAPNANIEGTVKRVAPAAEEREFGQVVRVVVEVPNPDGRLTRNMTGFGKVVVDERPAWEVFTRVVIRFVKIEMWSWLP